MAYHPLVFYPLALFICVMALNVLLASNPIFSALYLVMSMVGLGVMFMVMGAYFLGGVQLAVYAGAVTVLFVMVLMLFDLQKNTNAVAKGALSRLVKVSSVGVFIGLITGALSLTTYKGGGMEFEDAAASMAQTKVLARALFSEYIVAFEILGVLLLVIAIGVVSVSRIKGGTHARD